MNARKAGYHMPLFMRLSVIVLILTCCLLFVTFAIYLGVHA